MVVDLPRAPAGLAFARDEVLAVWGRIVRERRLEVAAEVLGVAGAWLGVVGGPVLTAVGVALLGATALAMLLGSDRRRALYEGLRSAHDELIVYEREWLAIALELGPYAYGTTTASGRSKTEVARDRVGVLSVRMANEFAAAAGGLPPPSVYRDELRNALHRVGDNDARGQEAHTHTRTLREAIHWVVAGGLVCGAVVTLGASLPLEVVATAATLTVLLAPSRDEATAVTGLAHRLDGIRSGPFAALDLRPDTLRHASLGDWEAVLRATVLVAPGGPS